MATPVVLLFYRTFQNRLPGMSHIGLGNNAIFTAKVLKTHNIPAFPIGVNTPADVQKAMSEHPDATHAVVEAIWFTAAQLASLAGSYPAVEWTCRNHSQMAFLQVEPPALQNFRDYATVQDGSTNFVISANSDRFCDFWTIAYRVKCLHLPNLYPLSVAPRPKVLRSDVRDTLRISSYGALRLLKNHTTAAAAAILIGRHLGRDVEFHINVNREPGGKQIQQAIEIMYANVPGMKLVEDEWTTWANFRHLAGSMDLGLCPSLTETFCLTAADHVSAGVPVVGSECIEWLGARSHAEFDSPEDIAAVGESLIMNPFAVQKQIAALEAFEKASEAAWLAWLGV